VLHDKPIYMEADKDNVHIEIGLQYNDAYSERFSASPTTSTPSTAARISPASAPR
jgi:DNA gyrase/topoisomerase IV subunit B